MSDALLGRQLKARGGMALGWFKGVQLQVQSARSYQWRWEEKAGLVVGLLDDALFHVLYAAEAVVLSAALCGFFLCCGCNI
ncbi:unnamed protein product [Alopecurus aequalis]